MSKNKREKSVDKPEFSDGVEKSAKGRLPQNKEEIKTSEIPSSMSNTPSGAEITEHENTQHDPKLTNSDEVETSGICAGFFNCLGF